MEGRDKELVSSTIPNLIREEGSSNSVTKTKLGERLKLDKIPVFLVMWLAKPESMT